MCPKDADGMANVVNLDQIAPSDQSDQGLYCLQRHLCPIT